MHKILIAVAVLSLAAVSAADAGSRHKRHKVRHHAHAMAYVAAPYTYHGPRPIWGAPQQCFTDEGYGRFWPCGAGPSTR